MDVALVGFMAGYVFTGWRSGLLHRIIGLGFLVISFVASAYLRYPIGVIATTFVKSVPVDYANLVGYAIAFPAILVALHIASHFILGRVRFEGLSKEIDQALGAVFGGVEAILIISAVVVIVDTYFGTSSSLRQTVGPGFVKTFAAALNGSPSWVHFCPRT
jgi:uncharacterized membrane protein required for colicin V production